VTKKRRHIPALGMNPRSRDSLRAEGFAAMAYEESMVREPDRLQPHYHDFFQVSLLRGSGRLMHDFREKEVAGLTLLFITPGQVHTVKPGDDLRGTILSFTREFFDGGSETAATLLLDLPFYFATDTPPWLALDPGRETEIPALFRELQSEYDQARPDSPEVIRALLRVLFIKARRLHSAQSPAPSTARASALVRSFQLAVENHFREWPSLAPYARELGVGVNHLNDVVSAATGRPAGEHIRLRRLLAAKRQLLHSELSVSEIGYLLGFKDPSYFGRFFRRYEQLTPAAFRLRSREKYQQEAG
jgi:AraC family transcriptional regulator, transcriptional activator of pobA